MSYAAPNIELGLGLRIAIGFADNGTKRVTAEFYGVRIRFTFLVMNHFTRFYQHDTCGKVFKVWFLTFDLFRTGYQFDSSYSMKGLSINYVDAEEGGGGSVESDQ